LAEYLNSNDIVPECAKGRVSLVRRDDSDEFIPLALEELSSIGFIEDYVEEHPEGSDRGGYVPTIHTSDECAYYDESAGEWYMC
jgi:hypothetical protein